MLGPELDGLLCNRLYIGRGRFGRRGVVSAGRCGVGWRETTMVNPPARPAARRPPSASAPRTSAMRRAELLLDGARARSVFAALLLVALHAPAVAQRSSSGAPHLLLASL